MHPILKMLANREPEPRCHIVVGDCIASMRSMPAKSVQCCVTSPPYFGLRDYGHDGQIGLEQTPDEFVAKLVEVFREVWRVLKDDGTVWLNLGDSYARTGGTDRKVSATATVGSTRNTMNQMSDRTQTAPAGLKDKDLIGIPWRVAFALQADGWYLRQDIIWHKPNPMPESVKDRCTKAHEYIFLLTKSPKYFFDSEAMKEPAMSPGNRIVTIDEKTLPGGKHGIAGARASGVVRLGGGETRNRRSVWTVATRPYKGAHFATFPPDLIRPCILAGSRPGDTVLDPFGGSGTTGQVALEEGRRAVLLELNPAYADLASERISKISR